MKNATFTILIVDDEQDYCDVMRMILTREGYRVLTCNSGHTALRLLKEKQIDLVLSDLLMPEMDGGELLRKIKENNDPVEVIIMTAYGTIEKAVQAMRDGAFTYVTKGEDPVELIHEISRVVEQRKLEKDNRILKEKVNKQEYMLESNNKKYLQLLDLAERAAQSDANILILGESGAGKEVLASYIHQKSARRDESFLELNCQALSESILESELFGHEKGAFTGAFQKRIGLFEGADQGTLFLDEIGGVSLNLQAKLLKVIENKRILRMGGNVSIEVDFRLITATNRNLQADMDEEHFRRDLFYRISTIVLELPPLRERKEDIQMFVEYFFRKYQMEMKKNITSISQNVEMFLLGYDYPGNIRELKNIVERLVVLSEDGKIKDEYLPTDILKSLDRNKVIEVPFNYEMTLKEHRSSLEREYIKNLILKYPGDMNKVADVLGITRRQLFNKLVEYELK